MARIQNQGHCRVCFWLLEYLLKMKPTNITTETDGQEMGLRLNTPQRKTFLTRSTWVGPCFWKFGLRAQLKHFLQQKISLMASWLGWRPLLKTCVAWWNICLCEWRRVGRLGSNYIPLGNHNSFSLQWSDRTLKDSVIIDSSVSH